jgi:hypothetical protein
VVKTHHGPMVTQRATWLAQEPPRSRARHLSARRTRCALGHGRGELADGTPDKEKARTSRTSIGPLLPVKTHQGAVSQQHEEPGSPHCRRWSPVTSELRPALLPMDRGRATRSLPGQEGDDVSQLFSCAQGHGKH